MIFGARYLFVEHGKLGSEILELQILGETSTKLRQNWQLVFDLKMGQLPSL